MSASDATHDPHAAREPWLRRYVFSVDHKTIGIQYGLTALVFLAVGFAFMIAMRRQLAWPGQVGMLPETYNQLGAMHGTIMVFLGVVPLAVGAFGNYLVPLMIGAPDMAFPKLNAWSYWSYLAGGAVMLASFLVKGGAAASGWTSYAPLSVIQAGHGQTVWLLGMVLLITSSLLGSVNTIVTIAHCRAPGLDMMRLPFLVWAQLVTAFLLLLAFPPLEGAAVLQLMDRLAGTSFFLPSGLVVSGEALHRSGGGDPLLWQHLFWFLAHPEVYVLILPAMGIVAEVLTTNARRPLWGYRTLVGAVLFLGVMSFLVWAHHMFLTSMGPAMSAFFQVTTMIISIPSVVILIGLLLTLHGGRMRFPTPMLFAVAFLPMFAIGGLTGLPLGLAAADMHLHDTWYVIGHFHYVVAPGTIFALFAGIYHWFPKVTGKRLSEGLGKLHFWPSLLFMNGIFFPMFLLGLMGAIRRVPDGQSYGWWESAKHGQAHATWSAYGLAVAQVPFLINLVWTLWKGTKSDERNPWAATSLEWATPTPPLPHGSFDAPVRVARAPYEYLAGATGEVAQRVGQEGPSCAPGRDFLPQWSAEAPDAQAGLQEPSAGGVGEGFPLPGQEPPGGVPHGIPCEVRPHPVTGWWNGRLGTWLFVLSEVMLFAGLFASFALLRSGAAAWPDGGAVLGRTLASFNTGVLLLSSLAIALAARAARTGAHGRFRAFASLTLGCAVAFLCVKGFEWAHHLPEHPPRESTFWALYYTLTGLHAAHIVGGALVLKWLLFPGSALAIRDRDHFANRVACASIYWQLVDAVWLVIFALFYWLPGSGS